MIPRTHKISSSLIPKMALWGLVATTALLLTAAWVSFGHARSSQTHVNAAVQGNRTAGGQTGIDLSASASQECTITYTYDDAGRLVGADYGDGRGIRYTYDPAGNLLQREVYGVQR